MTTITDVYKGFAKTMEDALTDLPSPEGGERHLGVTLYRTMLVELPVVISFGRVGFADMIKAVAELTGEDLDPEYHRVLPETLTRLSYRRVKYIETEEGFELDWLEGLTPVTVWVL